MRSLLMRQCQFTSRFRCSLAFPCLQSEGPGPSTLYTGTKQKRQLITQALTSQATVPTKQVILCEASPSNVQGLLQVFAVTSIADEKQAAVWHKFEFGAMRRLRRRSCEANVTPCRRLATIWPPALPVCTSSLYFRLAQR